MSPLHLNYFLSHFRFIYNPKYLFQNKSFSQTYYFKSEKSFVILTSLLGLKINPGNLESRFNLLGGQSNLLGGHMPTQLTCYLPPCNTHTHTHTHTPFFPVHLTPSSAHSNSEVDKYANLSKLSFVLMLLKAKWIFCYINFSKEWNCVNT